MVGAASFPLNQLEQARAAAAEIVRELVAAGHDVTVFLRPSSSQERIAGLPVKRVEGDVLVEADVERATQDGAAGPRGAGVHGVVVDSKGAVYAADTYGQRIQKFVPAGTSF